MNAEKKIIIVVESLNLGGSERQAVYLAKGLQSRNYQVSLLALGVTGNASPWIETLNIPKRHLNLPLYTHARHIVKSNNKLLRKYFRKEVPFALIPFTYWPNFYCNWVFSKSRVKKCFWNQRDIGIRFGEFKNLAKIISKSTLIIGNSTACVKSLTDYYDLGDAEFRLIFNGIEDKFFSIKYEVSNARVQNGLMLANIQKNKDHETLIFAWEIIKERFGSDCPILHFAGAKRGTFDDLYSLVKKLNLEDVVKFMGMMDDVLGLIRNMDFTVFSSNSEGSPNGLLECAAGGLPAVATDIPANREILGENYEYLTIKNNPSDIANKVMDMVQKRIKMAEISKSNRSKVRKSYGMSVMIDSYIELLES